MITLNLHSIVEFVSPIIGFIGILVILIGAVHALFKYIFTEKGKSSISARVVLNHHLVLGLDFLVGKDIMDTFLLHPGTTEWLDLATLVTVVAVRIILSYFLEKEIDHLESIK